MRRLASVLCVCLALAGCSSASDGALVVDENSSEPADYAYEIPEGAGDAFDRGEPLDILPAELDVTVGESIEIVNRDDRGHLVGPFYVGAQETLRQTFARTGEYVGVCSVHPSGEITVTVTDP